MKIQQMPSKAGREIFFAYIPSRIMQLLGWRKGTKLSVDIIKEDESIILKKSRW